MVGPQFNSSSQFLFNHLITAGSEPISLDQRDQPLPSAFPSHFHIAAAQNSTIDVVFVCSFKVSHRLGTRMGFEFLVSCIALQKSVNFSLFCKAVFIKQFLVFILGSFPIWKFSYYNFRVFWEIILFFGGVSNLSVIVIIWSLVYCVVLFWVVYICVGKISAATIIS